MIKNRFRGFTLIELLVVIAIIGILSAVVLASLNTARTKGSDAAVKSNLSTIQTQAELFYDSNGNSYGSSTGNNCNTGSTMFDPAGSLSGTIYKAVNSATSTYSGEVAGTDYRCTSGSSAYVVAAKLSSGYWCIDSTGAGKTEATLPGASALACP